MSDPLEFSEETIEQIAQRVVSLLAQNPTDHRRYVDAATLAAELAVDRDWVYSHAEELEAIRLGGPNGRLRFDRVRVQEILNPHQSAPTTRPSKRRQARALGSTQTQRRASGRTPARSPSHTNREVAPMMKPKRQVSPSSERRA